MVFTTTVAGPEVVVVGVVQVIEVVLATEILGQGLPPRVTVGVAPLSAPVKLVPEIVIGVPVVVGPKTGATDATVGAAT
jgi:hypothetical protein